MAQALLVLVRQLQATETVYRNLLSDIETRVTSHLDSSSETHVAYLVERYLQLEENLVQLLQYKHQLMSASDPAASEDNSCHVQPCAQCAAFNATGP